MEDLENNITAETTETKEVLDGGNAETVEDKAEDLTNDTEFTDSANDGGAQAENTKENGGKADVEVQSKEQNAEYARKRREAERRAEIERVRMETIIEATGGINPYTNEEIKDKADVEEYLLQKKIDKEGGDPITDYSKYQKKQRRDEDGRAEKEKATEQWYAEDRANFVKKYPDINISSLSRDARFMDYADGKIGKKPLADIYAGYLKFTKADEKTADAKEIAAQMIANKKASVGALSTSETTDKHFFTKEQVDKMTYADVEKNYDDIRASMKKWK